MSNLLCHALVPQLASRIGEAYALGCGYVLVPDSYLHFNLACLAMRLGSREDALVHVGRALALGFPDLKQIHDDNDLAPLVGDPAYEALFVEEARRREALAKAAKRPARKKAAPKKKTAKKAAKKSS